ncbi:hypothetical protein H0H81_008617 [Sphagnurus paluster]|uniref:N-acetyltransferase domain-containing protein n=1 Tax=Sphagnurus paluster TaxID=117069 RepID=A0A9P7FSJ4_9AGAR|nr:hypothetical protein H0H81_008617 [Sphagnurus paluster]
MAEEKTGAHGIFVRQYRHPDDLAHVRRIFVDATLKGRGSPYLVGQNQFSPSPGFYLAIAAVGMCLYAIELAQPAGLPTWITARVVRQAESLIGFLLIAWLVYAWYKRRQIKLFFNAFLEEGMTGELADVLKYFDLRVGQDGICIPNGPSGFWVAEEAGEVLGFVGLTEPGSADKGMRLDPKVGDVRRLAVAPEHQRKGIAEKVMHALATHARAHGIETLELNTSDYNKSALRFYEGLGWRIVGRKEYHGFLIAVMRQDLWRGGGSARK